ncbi:pectate lyase-like adhesive domain-containing protein [Enterococcus sp. C50]|uniref:pectate lyase-like adhesive domain-containing protein n=1 Tax=Enterococcus sp. C50 TaxID=3231311 RepID=UPI00349FD587
MIKKSIYFSVTLFTCAVMMNGSVGLAQTISNAERQNEIEVYKGLAEVSTPEQLKAALIDSSITEISLQNDLDLKETILANAKNKTIYGNNHKINANLFQIKVTVEDAQIALKDIKIENTDNYGVFWSDQPNVVLNVENVDFENGHQFTYLPSGELQVAGNFKCVSNLEEAFQGNKLTILPNAIADMRARVGYPNPATNGIDMIGTNPNVTIGENASLNVQGTLHGIHNNSNLTLTNEGVLEVHGFGGSAISVDNNSSAYFASGSTSKISGSTGIVGKNTDITVKNGATFEAIGTKAQGTIMSNGKIIFEEGANFKIVNNNSQKLGTIFGSNIGGKATIQLNSKEGVKTWVRGRALLQTPDQIYAEPVEAEFSLSGIGSTAVQEMISSSNEDFSADFMANQVGKIIGGSFVNDDTPWLLLPPTIQSEVTSVDDKLQGTGFKGATVIAKVNNVEIGRTTVDEDKQWVMDIPAQLTGTIIEVHQEYNDKVSLNITVNVK